jgi:hypothetical protein
MTKLKYFFETGLACAVVVVLILFSFLMVSESSATRPSLNVARVLTQTAYIDANMAGLPGHKPDPALSPQSDFTDAVLSLDNIKDTTVKDALLYNDRLPDHDKLHVRYYGSVAGIAYPIFTSDRIEETIGSTRPEDYLAFLKVNL